MNVKRRQLEQQVNAAMRLPVSMAIPKIEELTPQLMDEFSMCISDAIGTIDLATAPWLITVLETYARELREKITANGRGLADILKNVPVTVIHVHDTSAM